MEKGVLPATTRAPPLRVQPAAPVSKSPPGTSTYWRGSRNRANGWEYACPAQPSPELLVEPLEAAAGAARAPAASASTIVVRIAAIRTALALSFAACRRAQ